MSKRLGGMGVKGYDPKDPFKPTFHPDRMDEPLKQKKPAVIAVGFMGDLFHVDIPFRVIWEIYWMMVAKANWHTYLILTKRPGIMADFFNNHVARKTFGGKFETYMPNLYLGVTVEDQKTADERIPILLQIPGKHWVSYEPALGGPINIGNHTGIVNYRYDDPVERKSYIYDHPCGFIGEYPIRMWKDSKIDWLVAGCESGPGRRPANPDWFRDVQDQCQAAGVPYFLKQMEIDGKVKEMPELDGRVWGEMP